MCFPLIDESGDSNEIPLLVKLRRLRLTLKRRLKIVRCDCKRFANYLQQFAMLIDHLGIYFESNARCTAFTLTSALSSAVVMCSTLGT
jgi:hypothetical protein